MKKILFFILISSLFSAQTQRFIYEMKYKPDSTKAEYRTENMVLDVNPKEVKFYPYLVIKMDSLSNTSHPMMGWETALPYLKRDRNSDKNSSYFLNDALFKIESTTKSTGNFSPTRKLWTATNSRKPLRNLAEETGLRGFRKT